MIHLQYKNTGIHLFVHVIDELYSFYGTYPCKIKVFGSGGEYISKTKIMINIDESDYILVGG